MPQVVEPEAGITESLQFDSLPQSRGLGERSVQFCDEARHHSRDRVAFNFDFLRTGVAGGSEEVAVHGNFGSGGGFA